jgi:hypothetical protein
LFVEKEIDPFTRSELTLLVLSIDLIRTTAETETCLESIKFIRELA